jgi:hypothetical protein
MAITAQERQDILQTISDFHKDAYGFRPRGIDYHSMSDVELEACCDEYSKALQERNQEEASQLAISFEEYNKEIKTLIDNGSATDRVSAIKVMTEGMKFYHEQDVEYFLWNKGVLFHETRKELLEELNQAVTITYEY